MLEYILRREEQGKGNFDDITFKFSIGASPEFASIRLKSDNLCY